MKKKNNFVKEYNDNVILVKEISTIRTRIIN